jgi:hypothetical protein
MDLIAKADENTLIKQLEGDTEKSISLLMFTMALQTYRYAKILNNIKIEPFKSEQFVVQENKVSLDVIEHGF